MDNKNTIKAKRERKKKEKSEVKKRTKNVKGISKYTHKNKEKYNGYHESKAKKTTKHFPAILEKYGYRIRKATKDTEFYSNTLDIALDIESKYDTKVKVIVGDTIDVGCQMQKRKLNPVLLNMASSFKAGGGWRKGRTAQEESLFYRSTYAISLEDCMDIDKTRNWKYPIPIYGAIYSPDIFVFMDNNFNVFNWEDCVWFDFVAVPAVRKPTLINGTLSERDREITRKKIDGIFRVALHKGHDSVVLGALGCGAYGNPPEDVSVIFKEVIENYKGLFKEIVFAIYDDKNTGKKHNPDGNLSVFQKVFST